MITKRISVTFAFAYSFIVTYLSRGLVSSYVKADLRKRFSAAIVDGLVVVMLWYWYWTTGSVASVAIGTAYLLLRDSIGGQSVGKLFVGRRSDG